MWFPLHKRGCTVIHFSDLRKRLQSSEVEFQELSNNLPNVMKTNEWDGENQRDGENERDGEECTRAEVTHLAPRGRGFLSCPPPPAAW